MGGISGRQGRFSGLVTEGMSSMGPMMGLAGLRWAWAPAILALVGLVGLALCKDATGKGPACPGLECCTKKKKRERGDGWTVKKTTGRKERWGDRKWTRNEGRQQWGRPSIQMQHTLLWKRHVVRSCVWVATHAAQNTNDKVRKKVSNPWL